MKICLFSALIALNIFCTGAFADSGQENAYRERAVLDSQIYMGKMGQYQETLDGVTATHGQPCFLGRQIKVSEFKFPVDAADSARFSIYLGTGSPDITFSTVQYYIYSSGRYSSITGPAGFAKRTTSSNQKIVYSSPRLTMDSVSCGSLGHMSYPVNYTDMQFQFGNNFVQYTAKYKCGIFGTTHVMTKTCQF